LRTRVEQPRWKVMSALALMLVWADPNQAQLVASQEAAQIRKVDVVNSGDDIKVEVHVTGKINPKVIVATAPDRLVLELPKTTASAKQQHISVNRKGVQQVRIGLNSADPLIARVVVDLATAREYRMATAGDTITLTILPATAANHSDKRTSAAMPAASGPFMSKLWPWQKAATPKNTFISPVLVNADKPDAPETGGLRTSFQVKYVAEGAAYLNGGRSAGLAPGMTLIARDSSDFLDAPQTPVAAELHVVSVAETSAVTDIRASKVDVKPGDWAFLSTPDCAKLAGEGALNAIGTSQAERTPVKPTQGKRLRDPDEIALQQEDSRIRARVGFDYSGIHSTGSTLGSSGQIGLAFRTDMTHIAGTSWNLQGYWRGRLTTNSQAEEQTLQDYLDKTYIIQLTYDNPNSKWVAGFGRLYLPWAASIDTIDGGYVGRRVGHGMTAGVFGGSTPDPTSWHYQPDQQIAGSFVNFEGGDYDDFHYISTTGVALSLLKWQLNRPYVFFENGLSFKKYFYISHSLIVDSPQGLTTDGIKPGSGISRSYLAFHIQPHPRISFDIYHNYFRDVPTAATALIGTGLVDKLLYQGVSAGTRIEPVRHFFLYTTIGQSNKTGDAKRSLNQMYGITWDQILHTGIRADLHYSKFDSSFAQGEYRVLSLSRHLGDRMLWDAQFGSQSLASAFTANNHSFFFDTSLDTDIGRHTYVQSGVTFARGAQLNYDQWYVSLGYRFDVKGPVK
jgi:AMIN domain